MQQITVYLGLGSNLGDREDNLKQAIGLLSLRLRMGKISSVYDTAPVGVDNQPRFLNQVCQVYTKIGPVALLTLVKGFELKLGRSCDTAHSPRTIDIDILLYGDQVLNEPELVIPHPRMTERAFVLVPLAEIAPEVVHPVNGKTIKQLLESLPAKQDVVKLRTR